MSEIANGNLTAAIDTEIIQEILYRYSSLNRRDIAVRMTSYLFNLVPVVMPVNISDARVSVDLFDKYAPQGIPANDLIHAAVMQNNGIDTIISTDAYFDEIEGIVRLAPQAI